MARVTVVAKGQAQLVDPGNLPLETRIGTQLGAWYQVLDVTIARSYGLSFYYDYVATIQADTKNLPADIPSVAEKVRLACTLATSVEPNSVSVISAGQPIPTTPHTTIDSVVDLPQSVVDLVQKVSDGLGVTVKTAELIVVGVGIAALGLLLFIATKPATAARIARG